MVTRNAMSFRVRSRSQPSVKPSTRGSVCISNRTRGSFARPSSRRVREATLNAIPPSTMPGIIVTRLQTQSAIAPRELDRRRLASRRERHLGRTVPNDYYCCTCKLLKSQGCLVNASASGLERAVRRLGQRLFRRLYPRRRSAPSDLGSIDRILLVRTDKIGDAIVSTPVIQALREHFPKARIDILLGSRSKAAGPLLPYIDSVFVAGRGVRERLMLLHRLRKSHYDVVINLVFADSITAAVFTAGSGARMKIGFENSASAFLDFIVARPTLPMPFVPKLLLLIAPLGITVNPAEARPSITLLPAAIDAARHEIGRFSSDRTLLMINISGSSPRKFWGVERYAALARQLRFDGFDVVVLSAPADEQSLREIVDRSGAFMIAPRPDLMEFAAILSFADLVVSPDTSIVHIAAALGKPVVALVDAPVTAIEWAPWAVPNRVVGCSTGIPDILDKDVLSAVRDLAAEVAPPASSESAASRRLNSPV